MYFHNNDISFVACSNLSLLFGHSHAPVAVAEASPGLSRDLTFDLHWQTIILHSEMSAELF